MDIFEVEVQCQCFFLILILFYLTLCFSIFIFGNKYCNSLLTKYWLRFRLNQILSVILSFTKKKSCNFYPKKITDKVFQYCYSVSLLCWLVLSRKISFTYYFFFALLSRCARIPRDILFRLLSPKFFRRLIFKDVNDNIWQVKKVKISVSA